MYLRAITVLIHIDWDYFMRTEIQLCKWSSLPQITKFEENPKHWQILQTVILGYHWCGWTKTFVHPSSLLTYKFLSSVKLHKCSNTDVFVLIFPVNIIFAMSKNDDSTYNFTRPMEIMLKWWIFPLLLKLHNIWLLVWWILLHCNWWQSTYHQMVCSEWHVSVLRIDKI